MGPAVKQNHIFYRLCRLALSLCVSTAGSGRTKKITFFPRVEPSPEFDVEI
jgi:hypothetical protein